MRTIEQAIQHMKNSIQSYNNNLREIATVNSINRDWDGVSAMGQPISIEDKKYYFSVKGIEACETAITALQEKLERENGCPYCDIAKANENIRNTALWVKEAQTSKWTMMGKELIYCPMCGRKLKGSDQHE